jgi:A/G-specific adenine glycosylase
MAVVTARTLPQAQQRVLDWFDESSRKFPWREHRDPYRTLVAEVMLQQTQTGRVAPIYEEFLKKFPTVESLAHAPAMDVIKAWKGLGYNRRAVDLQRAAQAIVHAGEFPLTSTALRALPGVAEYTSAAVACVAFDEQVAVVDTNVRRVLARTALGKEPDAATPDSIRALATKWLPIGEAYRWNQALMDLGATLCRPDAPLCAHCPLRASCKYRAAGKHRKPRARVAKNEEPFEGSRRQKRGGIIDALRETASHGVTLAALARVIHPKGEDRSLTWLVELLEGLERDGLVAMSESARRGSPRGTVRLPG